MSYQNGIDVTTAKELSMTAGRLGLPSSPMHNGLGTSLGGHPRRPPGAVLRHTWANHMLHT